MDLWKKLWKLAKIGWPILREILDKLILGDEAAVDAAYDKLKAKVLPAAQAAHAKAQKAKK